MKQFLQVPTRDAVVAVASRTFLGLLTLLVAVIAIPSLVLAVVGVLWDPRPVLWMLFLLAGSFWAIWVDARRRSRMSDEYFDRLCRELWHDDTESGARP
jgi:hypothetical protein